VVALYYVADVSTDEIARTLGCAAATVRVHLHKAKAQLALALRAEMEDGHGR